MNSYNRIHLKIQFFRNSLQPRQWYQRQPKQKRGYQQKEQLDEKKRDVFCFLRSNEHKMHRSSLQPSFQRVNFKFEPYECFEFFDQSNFNERPSIFWLCAINATPKAIMEKENLSRNLGGIGLKDTWLSLVSEQNNPIQNKTILHTKF